MERRHVVVGFSVGTCLFLLGISFLICGALVLMHFNTQVQPQIKTPHFAGQSISDFSSQLRKEINDLKYGPVNKDATKEVKNGLFDRLRARRNAAPATVASCPPCTVVSSTDCTAAYSTALPVWSVIQNGTVSYVPVQSVTSTVASVPSQPEYPAINPLEVESLPTCTNCNQDPRAEVKTGSFVCSNCKKPQVGGQWHTDWTEDGMPVTFLCESCYRKMTPNQHLVAYKAYAQRQSIKGESILQQEIGE